MINGSIFSLLTLFALVHISILIVNIVFVLLDMCFDSNKSKYTCNKLSPQFFQNGTKNTNTILTYSECIEMLLPVNLHDSNVKFNCLVAVIIIVPYIVGICCHFPNQSKEIFIIAVRKLIVFLQTVNELWIFNGRFSISSLESLVHVVKLVVTVLFLKAKAFLQLSASQCSSCLGMPNSLGDLYPVVLYGFLDLETYVCIVQAAGCCVVIGVCRVVCVLAWVCCVKDDKTVGCSGLSYLVVSCCFISILGFKCVAAVMHFPEVLSIFLPALFCLLFCKKIQLYDCNASSPVVCLLVWIFAFCLHHATNSLLSMSYLNMEQMILLVLILVFASCYLKYIESLLFCMKAENFCLRAHGKKCLARSLSLERKSWSQIICREKIEIKKSKIKK